MQSRNIEASSEIVNIQNSSIDFKSSKSFKIEASNFAKWYIYYYKN